MAWLRVLSIGLLTTAPMLAHAAIAYVQSAWQAPQSGSTLKATFASAQAAGDFIVVVVGWSDTTSSVAVTDSAGNAYVLAGGSAVSPGNATSRIYYAKNIAAAPAGTNIVTAQYSVTTVWPELAILEYSGIDPVNPIDGAINASGAGFTQSAGPLTTANANDLLVSANYLIGNTTAGGAGYTTRLQTAGNEIVQDMIVSTTGSYTATSTQDNSGSPTGGWWLMNLVAFKAASATGTVDCD